MGSSPPIILLADTGLLRPDQVEALSKYSIRTVEDLVGSIESDEPSVRMILETTPADTKELHDQALALLPTEIQTAFDHQRRQTYPLGALKPDRIAR